LSTLTGRILVTSIRPISVLVRMGAPGCNEVFLKIGCGGTYRTVVVHVYHRDSANLVRLRKTPRTGPQQSLAFYPH